MPIYRIFSGLVVVLVTPYVLVAYNILSCRTCEISSNLLLAFLGLLFAAPYVLVALAVAALVAGILGVWRGLHAARPVSAAFGVIILIMGLHMGVRLLNWPGHKPNRTPDPNSTASILKKLRDGKEAAGDLKRLKAPPGFIAQGGDRRKTNRD